AGHFDTKTAYIAANTLRLDDMNPHFFKTHDGGKTWTEINNGIAPGWVSNAIREDPHKKGLLYASTDAQIWVSFAAAQHAGHFGSRYRSEGRRVVPVLGSGGRDAWSWVLDSGRSVSTASGRGSGGCLGRIFVQAGNRNSDSLRHERSDAVASGDAGGRESAQRGAGRLLFAEVGGRSEARI